MADDAAETGAEETGDQEEAKPETGQPTDWKAETEKWQALARKNEKQAKANADAANRLKELEPLARKAKELEDAGKSAEERLANERDAHRSRADRAESDLLRFRVALNKGLTATQAKRLVGATEEELEADAEELLASFRPAETAPGKEPPATGRTKERLRPGAVPDAEPVELDPAKLAQMVSRNQFG